MNVTLHPLGITLAVVFVGAIALLFRWMFNVPPALPHEVVAVSRSVAALQRIPVPLTSGVESGRAVELACRLGGAHKAEIGLAYVLEVPFTLSLETRLPAEEAKGEEALQKARLIVEQHGLAATTRFLPHRYAAAGIIHPAKVEDADAIAMSAGPAQARASAAPAKRSCGAPPVRSLWTARRHALPVLLWQSVGLACRRAERRTMRVVILGCGRSGAHLAQRLAAEGHQVAVIDRHSSAFRRLGPGLPGQLVTGTGIDGDVLRRAGIEEADAFVALTNGDNTNVMAAQVAREMFGVARVVCRIYDPLRADIYRELGLETICPTLSSATEVEGILAGSRA